MQVILKNSPNNTAKAIMHKATELSGSFITGKPIRVLEYGRGETGKITYVSFQTEGGIEDTYNKPYGSIVEAKENSFKVVKFRVIKA